VLWGEIFDFTDLIPPTTAFVPDREADGVDDWYRAEVDVVLVSEDEDLRGTEYHYRLRGAESIGWLLYRGPFTIDSEGYTDIAFRSVDVNGNVEAEQNQELRLDQTEPEVTVSCPTDPVVINASAVSTVTASDELSGFAEDPNGTFPLDTSQIGVHTHRVEVQDRAGNTAAATCQLTVVYGDGQVRQPIRNDGQSTFRAGSTIPVKLGLVDADGIAPSDATVTFSYIKLSNAIAGTVTGSVPATAATTGNQFRWDPVESQYVYNWSTRGLATGTYELRVEVGEGAPRTVIVSLR
jgi:hypothetical protein